MAAAFAIGALLNAVDADGTATLVAAACFVAIAVPAPMIAAGLRRRN